MNGRKFEMTDVQPRDKWSRTGLPGVLEWSRFDLAPPLKGTVKKKDKFKEIILPIRKIVKIQQDEGDTLTLSQPGGGGTLCPLPHLHFVMELPNCSEFWEMAS